MRRALCPGTFDPVTQGHIDVFRRTAALFDEVIVGVGKNTTKNPIFDCDERIAMIEEALVGQANIRVMPLVGLLVNFCAANEISVIVKGARTGTDFDYEQPQAQMNRAMSGIETVLLPTDAQWSFVSSTLIREIASLGGSISAFVPENVVTRMAARLKCQSKGER